MTHTKKPLEFETSGFLNPAKDSHSIETAQSLDALRADGALAPSEFD